MQQSWLDKNYCKLIFDTPGRQFRPNFQTKYIEDSEQNILIAPRQVKWEDTSLLVAASALNVKMLLLSLFCEVYVHLSISERALCSTRRVIASQLARATRSSKKTTRASHIANSSYFLCHQVSKACTSICQWVRAMHKYHFVAKAVAPKRVNAVFQHVLKH